MNYRIFSLCAAFLGLNIYAAGTKEVEVLPVSPESFEATACLIATNSPILQSYMLEAESELESMREEMSLPAPEIEGRHLWGQNGEGNKWGIGVSQSFDWPGVYTARRRAAGRGADAVEALRLANYSDKVLEVRQELTSLIGARKRIGLCKEVKANIDRLAELINEGYRRGETTRLDVNKMAIEKLNAEQSLNEALNAEQEIIARLTALNGGAEPQLDGMTEYPIARLASLEEYEEAAVNNNPQRKYLEASLRQREAQLKAEKLSRLPGFSIGYEYENEAGEKFNGISASVSLPFFSGRHRVKSARLAAEASELQRKANETDDLWRVRGEYKTASRLGRELSEYGPVVEGTDNIALLRKAYEGGEMSLIDYLRELTYFTDARNMYLELEQNYRQALVSLGRYGTISRPE